MVNIAVCRFLEFQELFALHDRESAPLFSVHHPTELGKLMWNMCLFFRQGKVRKPNNRYKPQKQHVHRAWSRKSGDRKWACSFQVYSLREHLQIKFYPSLILDYSVFFYCSFRPLLLWLVFIPRFATFVNSTKRFVKGLNPEVISKVGWVWLSGWT